MLGFQALCMCFCLCRCLCHCLCLCICVLLWFLNSFHHKLSAKPMSRYNDHLFSSYVWLLERKLYLYTLKIFNTFAIGQRLENRQKTSDKKVLKLIAQCFLQGKTPRPPGQGGFPAKMVKTTGQLQGKIKGHTRTFPIQESHNEKKYDNTEKWLTS